MSGPQLSPDRKSESRLVRFWANGGVFSIIALCFFLLSFANPGFLAPGIVFMAISLIWTAKDKISQRRSLIDSEDAAYSD